MAIFKCKMCGGALEIHGNETVVECEYCGTQQTLPRLDDDRKANLYDRANHFRRNNEFDKAMSIFEQILNEDNTDAETYWSLVLCRYGIEYVEDPSSHKRIPTINRAQFTSIFDDDNYKSALKYADSYQKAIYENEAKTINEIQKGILAISQEEEPFDVFICYKETDNQGRRTSDSVLANELYHQLTQEGFKVFFAKIILEDKLGVAYEPYIFAALNSAKVMVVLGTKPEFFKAVWVKNEWSRYLSLIKQGQKKILIPAYKDMDPYDLPDEFSHLQALDMSKLGFMQDLIRGIKKIIGIQQSIPTVTNVVTEVNNTNVNINALLKRGMLMLEDKEWDKADNFFEEVLNNDPECAEAYLGKLMTSLKVSVRENLKNLKQTFKDNNHYLKVMRFGSEELKKELRGYNDYIVERNKSEAYNNAIELMNVSSFIDAINIFEELEDYRDSIEMIKEIKDALEQERIERKRQEEMKAKQNKKMAIIVAIVAIIIAIAIFVLNTVIIPNNKYNEAISLIESGDVIEAYDILDSLDGYKDSDEQKKSIYKEYETAKLKAANVGDYVFFGSFEQDNDTSNGKEDIEWLVLDKKDNKILVISKYGLDAVRYNAKNENITWEESSLRQWLNYNFIHNAFNSGQKDLISITNVIADKNPKDYTNPVNNTKDKVFLLSIKEANEYFKTSYDRQCILTKYAISKGAYKNDKGNCAWWLRSPGNLRSTAAYVDDGGDVYEGGLLVSVDRFAIRPAMWIDISK